VTHEGAMDAYCIKCKVRRDMLSAWTKTSDTGRRMVHGYCGECGSRMNRILSHGAPDPQLPTEEPHVITLGVPLDFGRETAMGGYSIFGGEINGVKLTPRRKRINEKFWEWLHDWSAKHVDRCC